jgi:hypothetical protein
MTLTKRGRTVLELTLVTLVLVLSGVIVISAYLVGQSWKQDRLDTDKAGTIPPASFTCLEDEPCWDCHTMGNKECGP